jgi:hypothetical protein
MKRALKASFLLLSFLFAYPLFCLIRIGNETYLDIPPNGLQTMEWRFFRHCEPELAKIVKNPQIKDQECKATIDRIRKNSLIVYHYLEDLMDEPLSNDERIDRFAKNYPNYAKAYEWFYFLNNP